MANINKIKLSGTTYNIQDLNAPKTVELTQAQYDALSTKDPNTFYIITDAQAADLSQYYTSAQTESAITQAVSGKVDTSTFNTYSGSVDTALSGKQETLVSGANIKTINNESLLGSGNIDIQGGGGKAIEAGRGISVTTGETADTVSFNLPISAGTGTDSLIFNSYARAQGQDSIAFGYNSFAANSGSFAIGGNTASGSKSFAGGDGGTNAMGQFSFAFGYNAEVRGNGAAALGGYFLKTNNNAEIAFGNSNVSRTGSTDDLITIFTVGNGTSSARHNAFEIRQNGDIYLSLNGQDVKLQDQLGGGGGASYSAGTGIDITNDVISVSGVVMSSAVTSAITSGSTDVVTSGGVYDQLGGMKIVKLTESEYTALVTKDSNTLYCVVPDPSN